MIFSTESPYKSKLGIKTWIALAWSLFTLTLVSWWIYIFTNHQDQFNSKTQRMLFMEGSVLLLAILGGSAALLVLSYRDNLRHERLKFFFSQFSHDLKTSITRLRLQNEILIEELNEKERKGLQELNRNISLLDLQLENSLWMSRTDELHPHIQLCRLSGLISEVKNEFPDLNISLDREAEFLGDKRFTLCVFRNLLSNSITHGEATEIQIKASPLDQLNLKITFVDNGKGDKEKNPLGNSPLESSSQHGSGIGLFLCRKLMSLQKGYLNFTPSSEGGFKVELTFLQGFKS